MGHYLCVWTLHSRQLRLRACSSLHYDRCLNTSCNQALSSLGKAWPTHACTWQLGGYLRSNLHLASLMVWCDSQYNVYSIMIWSETLNALAFLYTFMIILKLYLFTFILIAFSSIHVKQPFRYSELVVRFPCRVVFRLDQSVCITFCSLSIFYPLSAC